MCAKFQHNKKNSYNMYIYIYIMLPLSSNLAVSALWGEAVCRTQAPFFGTK